MFNGAAEHDKKVIILKSSNERMVSPWLAKDINGAQLYTVYANKNKKIMNIWQTMKLL